MFPPNTPPEIVDIQKLIFMAGAVQCHELIMSYAELSDTHAERAMANLDKEFNDFARNSLREKMGVTPEQLLNYTKPKKGGVN